MEKEKQEINEQLINAAKQNDLPGVKFAINQGADINYKGGFFKYQPKLRTALMWAVSEGHFDIIQYLIDLGADVNLQDSDGNTIMHIIAYRTGGKTDEVLEKEKH